MKPFVRGHPLSVNSGEVEAARRCRYRRVIVQIRRCGDSNLD